MSQSTPSIDPHRTALLVMDYQPSVLASLDETEHLLDHVQDAIATLRRHGGHIAYVRVAFDTADVDAIPEHSRMYRIAQLARDHLHKDAPATAVHARLAPEAGDIVVRKTRVGAFSTTDLDEQLRARGITTLLLAGVSTSGVVLSTVRDAHDRDYTVYVLADATADPKPHVHEFLTEHVFPTQADVITVSGLKRLFDDTMKREGEGN
ncbi:cysteine hydrolase family protein [Flexivirga caeni]|uniref:Cysteine hydrolase n=1 Tax=Flexivirga caeni TaxID=2294115 RepID=A0A3M9MHU5_9MICO|nr:cysteine hydrolase [Flexivirga caeni]RNI24727.1 cysteine hydrolase [Flexivirga caeni]